MNHNDMMDMALAPIEAQRDDALEALAKAEAERDELRAYLHDLLENVRYFRDDLWVMDWEQVEKLMKKARGEGGHR